MSEALPPFVDTHVHMWDLDRFEYPWLAHPDFEVLRHDYLPNQWLADAGELALTGAVHVQAEVDHAVDPVEETAWLSSLDLGSGAPPLACVAYADLRSPQLEQLLERHAGAGPVSGIRQEAWFDPRSDRADIPRFNLLDDPTWRQGLARLARRELSFDLLVWPHQLEQAAEIFAALPELPVVLEHTGLPPLGDPEGMEVWRRGMRTFSDAVPGSMLKVSAMAFISGGWTVAAVAPVVREAIETFGPQRCMFGSNFPVDRTAATYEQIWAGYAAMVADFSAAEREALFRANALRTYRLLPINN